MSTTITQLPEVANALSRWVHQRISIEIGSAVAAEGVMRSNQATLKNVTVDYWNEERSLNLKATGGINVWFVEGKLDRPLTISEKELSGSVGGVVVTVSLEAKAEVIADDDLPF